MLPWLALDAAGAALAVASGAVTSGIGYAIWYSALRGLKAASAATVQLSVPPLAALGGVVLLGEPLTLRLLLASVAILGGIALVTAETVPAAALTSGADRPAAVNLDSAHEQGLAADGVRRHRARHRHRAGGRCVAPRAARPAARLPPPPADARHRRPAPDRDPDREGVRLGAATRSRDDRGRRLPAQPGDRRPRPSRAAGDRAEGRRPACAGRRSQRFSPAPRRPSSPSPSASRALAWFFFANWLR